MNNRWLPLDRLRALLDPATPADYAIRTNNEPLDDERVGELAERLRRTATTFGRVPASRVTQRFASDRQHARARFANRWLPGPRGGRPLSRVAALAAVVAGLAVTASAIALNRESIAHLLLPGEERRLYERARSEEQLHERLEISRLKSELDKSAAERRELAVRTAERDRQIQLLQEQFAAAMRQRQEPRTSPPTTKPPRTPDYLRVAVLRHLIGYRVTVGGALAESDRLEYKKRFAEGCNVPLSEIVDIPQGFIVTTDGCTEQTFAGFEVVTR